MNWLAVRRTPKACLFALFFMAFSITESTVGAPLPVPSDAASGALLMVSVLRGRGWGDRAVWFSCPFRFFMGGPAL
jgi:hypothetical protein